MQGSPVICFVSIEVAGEWRYDGDRGDDGGSSLRWRRRLCGGAMKKTVMEKCSGGHDQGRDESHFRFGGRMRFSGEHSGGDTVVIGWSEVVHGGHRCGAGN